MRSHIRYAVIALAIVGFCALGYALDWWAIYSEYNPVTRAYNVESFRWEIMGYRAFYQGDFGGVWTLSFFQSFVVPSVASVLFLTVFSKRKPKQ